MGRVILLAQQKGGAGKTTLLTQLAAHYAGQGERVVILDLDPQRSAAGWFAAREGRLGHGGGIVLGESKEWRAASDMKEWAGKADRVLVDAPGSADVLGRGAMRAADFALIPCQPSMADVWASEPTLAMAAKAGLPHALVLNRMPPRGRAADTVIARLAEIGAPVLEARLGQRTAFVEAFMAGAGVTEMAPRSKAAGEIAALAEALDRELG
ncbi:MAG TPA: ParA family partition ATPase [Thermohalobaculum sp.]|nr:ParA family partition ATPase [Thermohalobaculum sp.]